MLRRTLISLALAGTAALGLGCTGGGNGKVRVATEAQYPPFELVDDAGTITGFDVELMEAIAKAGGFEVEFTNQPFKGIIPGLKAKRYDAVISAMTITDERSEQVAFSDPYYKAGLVICVREDEAAITGAESLAGKTIAVQMNTTGATFANKLPGSPKVKQFKNVELAFTELLVGRADAVINDSPNSDLYIKQHGKVKTAGDLLSTEHYGIAVRLDDADLLAKINAGLKAVRADGTYDALRQKWIGGGK